MLRKHIEFVRARTSVLREKLFAAWGRRLFALFILIAVFLVVLVSVHALVFGPAGTDTTRESVIVRPDESLDEVAATLELEGYVRHASAFLIAYALTRGEGTLRPGGYELSRDMDTWTIAKTLGEAPYLSWITIPNGVRKEEIADLFTTALGWTAEERSDWLAATMLAPDQHEGVYYPHTYLIPSDQPPAEVAARLRGRFAEVFAPYAERAKEQQLSWTDVITLASLVERESAKNDKKLVAGILWNRLNKGMLLQVDATLQYIEGTEGSWWPSPRPDDKYATSTFNTYKYPGLPPHAIANPSLASVDAVLNPDKTSCLYYLHDTHGKIHCTTTYKAHLANVNTYLR